MQEKISNISVEEKDNFFDLSKIIKIVWKHKLFIFITTLIISLIVLFLLIFVLKPVFMSTATVKTATKTSGLGSLLGSASGMSGLGDLGDLTGSSPTTKELTLYENILSTRNNVEATIVKFNLNDEWKYETMQEAVKFFRENILITAKDKNAGTLEIGAYDVYPQRAKEITEFLVTQLNKIYADIQGQNAKSNRIFIESRLNIIKDDLKKAEDSLKTYQLSYGVAPDVIAKYATTAELQLETEIKQEEIKLDLLKKILTPEQADIKIQEDKIALLKNQLNEIKNSPDNKSNLRLKNTPDIVMNFIRLQRNVEIQNKLLVYITPIYEQAKIDENKDTPTVLVIDPPYLPEKKVKPKRMIILGATLLGSLLILSFASVLYETFVKDLIRKLKESNVD